MRFDSKGSEMIRHFCRNIYQSDENFTLDELRNYNIKVVIDVCDKEKFATVNDLPVKYFHIPLADCQPIPEWIIDFVKTINENVLVHCCAGLSRSVRVCQLVCGMTEEQARSIVPNSLGCVQSQPIKKV